MTAANICEGHAHIPRWIFASSEYRAMRPCEKLLLLHLHVMHHAHDTFIIDPEDTYVFSFFKAHAKDVRQRIRALIDGGFLEVVGKVKVPGVVGPPNRLFRFVVKEG